MRHLLGNPAGAFSAQKFYDALRSQGLSISKDTIHQLMAHLEDCFLVRTVWLETPSEQRRMVNPRKVYPVDPGLIPVFTVSGGAGIGHSLETLVLIELERRGTNVTYVRSEEGHEVDFLARQPGAGVELIQVCADATIQATLERELRGLGDAGRRFPKATRRLLTLTRDALPKGRSPPASSHNPPTSGSSPRPIHMAAQSQVAFPDAPDLACSAIPVDPGP